jgi:hypothetical protein
MTRAVECDQAALADQRGLPGASLTSNSAIYGDYSVVIKLMPAGRSTRSTRAGDHAAVPDHNALLQVKRRLRLSIWAASVVGFAVLPGTL